MNTIVNPRELQRLRYTPGQDLLSRDFRDQAAFDEQLRWWHNRAMHGAFGVCYGLTARPLSEAAQPQVEVGPGLAYDSFGRDLRLAAPRSLRVPAGPQETEPRVLVIRHADHPGRLASAGAMGACNGGSARDAEVAWIPSRMLRPESGVPLARVVYRDGEPVRDEHFRAPVARPLARPRLGRGSTVAGATEWERWDFGTDRSFVLGLQVSIDTRAAGFTEVPCYFAWLQGGIETRLAADGPSLLLPLYSHLAAPTLSGFRFRMTTFALGRRVAANQNVILSIARRRLTVCWLGVQMRSGEHALPEVWHGHP